MMGKYPRGVAVQGRMEPTQECHVQLLSPDVARGIGGRRGDPSVPLNVASFSPRYLFGQHGAATSAPWFSSSQEDAPLSAFNMLAEDGVKIRAETKERHKDAVTRYDLLEKMRDFHYSIPPKPAKPVELPGFRLPCDDYPRVERPPRHGLIGSFSLKSLSTLMQATCKAHDLGYFWVPLSESEKRTLIIHESGRMDEVVDAHFDWCSDPNIPGEIDRALFSSSAALFNPVIPGNLLVLPVCFLKDYSNDDTSRYCIINKDAVLVCLIYVDDLDCSQEIHELACSETLVKPSRSGDRSAVWTLDSNYDTPKHNKAKAILEWAFNTAFELDVTRIKIGDGWHNIWLTVEKGVMTVGPSRIYTRSTPDITASYQDYTLIEVMYAFVYSAIVSKRGNVDQKNLILLDEEVEEAKDLRLHQSALFGFKDIRPAAAPVPKSPSGVKTRSHTSRNQPKPASTSEQDRLSSVEDGPSVDPPAVRQLGRQQPPSSRRAATLPLPSKEWDVAANRDRLLRRRRVVSLPVPPKVPTIDRQEPDIFQPSQSDDSSPPRRTPNATSNNAPKFASTNIDYREETPGRMVRDGSVPSPPMVITPRKRRNVERYLPWNYNKSKRRIWR